MFLYNLITISSEGFTPPDATEGFRVYASTEQAVNISAIFQRHFALFVKRIEYEGTMVCRHAMLVYYLRACGLYPVVVVPALWFESCPFAAPFPPSLQAAQVRDSVRSTKVHLLHCHNNLGGSGALLRSTVGRPPLNFGYLHPNEHLRNATKRLQRSCTCVVGAAFLHFQLDSISLPRSILK